MKGISTLLAALALLLAAAAAHAQVAAPDFLPGAPRIFAIGQVMINGTSITPDNPAALQWGGPSQLALGTLRNMDAVTSASTSGTYFGGRHVAQRWAGAFEYASDTDDASLAKEKVIGLSLSGTLGDSLAVGYGYESYKNDVATISVTDNALGASWRLGKSFYVGGAISSSKGDDGLTSADRNTTLYGLALRTEGNTRFYLAYDVVDRDTFSNTIAFGVTQTTMAAQVAFGDLVLGASSNSLDRKDIASNLKSRVVSIGWVPVKGGLSLVVHSMSGTDALSGASEKGTNLTIAYLY
jgi:hypothetical protein